VQQRRPKEDQGEGSRRDDLMQAPYGIVINLRGLTRGKKGSLPIAELSRGKCGSKERCQEPRATMFMKGGKKPEK